MTHFLELMVAGIFGVIAYELVGRWFEKRKGQNRRASDPADPNAAEIPE